MKPGKLTDIHRKCLELNLPFATWRLPEHTTCETIISAKAEEIQDPDFSDLEGFVAAPFKFLSHKRLWLLPIFYQFTENNFDLSGLEDIHQIPSQKSSEIRETSFDSYKQHFNYFKNRFEQGTLQKAVLSRVKISETINRVFAPHFYEQLRKAYPHAMVYLMNIPEMGVWVGATPETLLRESGYGFLTESVAATRTISTTGRAWTEKEITEQDMVTDYIRDVLEKNHIGIYRMEGPTDHLAGNVEHLKTDFEIPYNNLLPKLSDFLQELHPTPAVCGLPKEQAYNEILNTENHDRELYSGFLGPVGLQDKLQLFVNLRCMQLFDKYAALYVGGGLTKDSVLNMEWEETRQKAQTLLNIANRYE